jgi:DNA primase
MRWVDFREVKEKVAIRDVLRHYNVEGLKESNDTLIGPCPVHGGDSPTAFHADLKKNIWHCFTGCKQGGNVLDLVALKENISIRAAALKLQELFLQPGISNPALPAEKKPNGSRADVEGHSNAGDHSQADNPPNSPPGNHPLELTINLSPDHPYLLNERRLTLATIKRFGLGYCHQGTQKGRIAIPIHDERGQLVAYVGRRIKNSKKDQTDPARPKYKFPKGFKKHFVLYNLHQAKEEVIRTGHIILVEGFFDVFRLYEAGYLNAVALMGTSMSPEQEALVLSSASRATIFFDGDDAGRDCAEECLWRLVPGIFVRIVELNEGEEPDNLSQERLKMLLG